MASRCNIDEEQVDHLGIRIENSRCRGCVIDDLTQIAVGPRRVRALVRESAVVLNHVRQEIDVDARLHQIVSIFASMSARWASSPNTVAGELPSSSAVSMSWISTRYAIGRGGFVTSAAETAVGKASAATATSVVIGFRQYMRIYHDES